jgi:sulfotransferase family protein
MTHILLQTAHHLIREARTASRVLGAQLAYASHRFFIDAGGDHRSTVLLAGSGRSGTTWVSEIINFDRRYRYMFEPFHSDKVRRCRAFGAMTYLRPDARDDERLAVASSVLGGRLRAGWVDRYNKTWLSKDRLVKDIRANLFLKWLSVNFQGMPVVLLLRHPLATVASRLSLHWRPLTDAYLSNPELVEDHLGGVAEEMAGTTDPFEQQMYRWCVETVVPLRQFATGEIHLAFYEGFVADPDSEISALFDHIGRDYDPRALGELSIPSSQVRRRKSAIATRRDPLTQWRDEITPAQTKRALHILGLFGLDRIYNEDPMPDASAARAMLAK